MQRWRATTAGRRIALEPLISFVHQCIQFTQKGNRFLWVKVFCIDDLVADFEESFPFGFGHLLRLRPDAPLYHV